MKGVAWKPQAYRRAASAMNNVEDVRAIYKKGGLEALMEIPGVGEAIAKKIEEYIKTGKIKHHDELVGKLPKEFAIIAELPSLGPKKAKKLYYKLGIKTVKQLEKAAKEGKIREIPTFGEKSEKDILEGIQLFRARGGKRWPLKEAQAIANKIIKHLKRVKGVERVTVAGSIRRQRLTIGDIDIIATASNSDKVIEAFVTYKDVKKILARGPTKAMIVLKNNMQADVRVVKDEVYGAALQYFTGPKNFNIKLRQIAIKKGYKLSEYGLFDRKTGKLIAAKTEEEIFKKLGVPYVHYKKRD